MENLPEDVGVLSVIRVGYATHFMAMPAFGEKNGNASAEVTLSRGGTVEGTYLVDGKAPGQRLNRTLIRYPGLDRSTLLSEKADSKGHYLIKRVRPGEALVQSRYAAEGSRELSYRSVPVVIEEDGVIEVNFDWNTEGGVVEGRVIDPLERRLGNRVLVSVESDEATFSYEAHVDEDGNYRAVGVPAGQVTIQYPGRAGDISASPGRLGRGESIRQDIEITASGVIEYQTGRSRDGAVVFVFILSGEVEISEMNYRVYRDLELQALAVSGSNISYRTPIRGLERGVYTLVAVEADVWTEAGIDAARFATSVVEVGDSDDVPFVEFEF